MEQHQKIWRSGAYKASEGENSKQDFKSDVNEKTAIALLMKHSEAIGHNPNDRDSRFSRCECLLAMKEYKLAFCDALKVTEIDRTFRLGYYKALDCAIMIGYLTEADELVEKFRSFSPQIDTIERNQVVKINRLKQLHEEITRSFEVCNFTKCLQFIEEGAKISPASLELLVMKMKCLICLKNNEDARRLGIEINAAVHPEVRIFEAFESYYEGDFKTSLSLFAEISNFMNRKINAISDTETKATHIFNAINKVELKLPGIKLFNSATEILERCLKVDLTNKEIEYILLLKILQAQCDEGNDIPLALQKLEGLLKKNPKHADTLFLKAQLLMKQNLYFEAMEELEKILSMNVPTLMNEKVKQLQYEINIEMFYNPTANNEENCENSFSSSSFGQNESEETTKSWMDLKNSPPLEPKLYKRISALYSFTAEDTKNKTHFKEFIGKSKEPTVETNWKEAHAEAEKKNKEAVECYNSENYQSALKLYSDAIVLSPKDVKFLTNRSACFMAMENYDSAIADAIKAIELDPVAIKGYLRAINCYLVLGNIQSAKSHVEKLKKNIPFADSIDFNEVPKLESLTEAHSKIEEYYETKNFVECLRNLEIALKIARQNLNYRDLKAECLIMLQRREEANNIIEKALQNNARDANMIYLQGLEFYYDSDLQKSISMFDDALKHNSEHKKAKKMKDTAKKLMEISKQGSDFYVLAKFFEAHQCFSSAIEIDPTNLKAKFGLLFNRGATNSRLERLKEACDDFTEALKIYETHAGCLFKRAEIHFKLGEYENCIIDCEESLRLADYKPTKGLLEDAKFNIRLSKNRTPHDILGVCLSASKEDIKKAFFKLSLQFHSDKHPDATTVDKKKLVRKFQEVKTAYALLVQNI